MSLRSTRSPGNHAADSEDKNSVATRSGMGVTIAHKTGDIGFNNWEDVGLVDIATAEALHRYRYGKTPHNDNRAQGLIRQISRCCLSNSLINQLLFMLQLLLATTPVRGAGEVRVKSQSQKVFNNCFLFSSLLR